MKEDAINEQVAWAMRSMLRSDVRFVLHVFARRMYAEGAADAMREREVATTKAEEIYTVMLAAWRASAMGHGDTAAALEAKARALAEEAG